jgi:hypothetical protein
VSRRKLRALAAATTLEDLRQPPANHLEALAGDRAGRDGTASASMTNGDCASSGVMATRTTLKLSITMEGDHGHPD